MTLPEGVDPLRDVAGGTLVECRHARRKPIRTTFGRTLSICPTCKTSGDLPVKMLIPLVERRDVQEALF